ncbi:AcrR family transcriptional regulator [Saccharothrix ecbatanensis]|uniref:AcrR family transcriptional regulator n=2 Tax=Saccharothrix ecbatanensis TaxID=1105145 RepID=A0A7W9LXZ2_9PSEU|nr:AcrR family transcriptional regulator [Saccharothrix ecbatanensis]
MREILKRMRLTRDRVLTTAIQLADESGLHALSMRKLAGELGVEAMSLYNHVTSKEDLFDGVSDLVIGEINTPSVGEPWRNAMHRRAVSAHQVLRQHHWAVGMIASRQLVGPLQLAHYDATLGCLHVAGFSYRLAGHALSLIDSHVFGFLVRRLDLPFDPDKMDAWVERNMPQIDPAKYPHVHALAQRIIDAEYQDADFEFGLELILDGLEKLLATAVDN